jgi:hypothetical protein
MIKARLVAIGALAALLTITACASPVRTTELDRVDQFSGYRYETLELKAPKTVDKAAVVLTFSGGGTRAAALADGFMGTNIPGKTRAILLNPIPAPAYRAKCNEAAANGYRDFVVE